MKIKIDTSAIIDTAGITLHVGNAPIPVIDETLTYLRAQLDKHTDRNGHALGEYGSDNERRVDRLYHRIWEVEGIAASLREGNHLIGTMGKI
tara:strand:+ start:1199 stop:1474 length:276 start_codon:yes stop_codon:yes gene_type:complete